VSSCSEGRLDYMQDLIVLVISLLGSYVWGRLACSSGMLVTGLSKANILGCSCYVAGKPGLESDAKKVLVMALVLVC